MKNDLDHIPILISVSLSASVFHFFNSKTYVSISSLLNKRPHISPAFSVINFIDYEAISIVENTILSKRKTLLLLFNPRMKISSSSDAHLIIKSGMMIHHL